MITEERLNEIKGMLKDDMCWIKTRNDRAIISELVDNIDALFTTIQQLRSNHSFLYADHLRDQWILKRAKEIDSVVVFQAECEFTEAQEEQEFHDSSEWR